MISPWDVLPIHMKRTVLEADARDEREAELAELARQDEAASRAIMARHAENVHIAMTGHSTSDWMAAQQQRATALAEAGYDPSAPLGSPQHPEPLIDGASVRPSRGPAARAVAEASRYQTVSGIDAALSRNAEEAQAWRSPVMMRVRQAALESEIRRKGGTVPPRPRPVTSTAGGGRREITRAGWAPDPRLPVQVRLPAGDW